MDWVVGAALVGAIVGACVGGSVTGDREGLDVSPCVGLRAMSSDVSSVGDTGG